MNTLPRLPKVLGILLIFLLVVLFALGAAVEVAPKYINLLLPIVFLVVIAFGIGFYYNSKRKGLARAHRMDKKATIAISLVDESSESSNREIEKEDI